MCCNFYLINRIVTAKGTGDVDDWGYRRNNIKSIGVNSISNSMFVYFYSEEYLSSFDYYKISRFYKRMIFFLSYT